MRTLGTVAALALTLMALPAQAGPGDRARPFAGMSEPGRRAMTQSMLATDAADRADRERVRGARDRMMGIIAADRLDAAALRRAMDEEREAANVMRTRRQAAMLQALQGLSVADRRAFVADARSMRGRVEGRFPRLKAMRDGQRGGPDPLPPL